MPVEISDWNDLDNVRNDLTGDYVLVNDLDSQTAGYDEVASATANGGSGWEPLAESDVDTFDGSFNGGGNSISDIVTDRFGTRGGGSTFGDLGSAGLIENVSVFDADMKGGVVSGVVVADNFGGDIVNCTSFGVLETDGNGCGGLVGQQRDSNALVQNSFSDVDVLSTGTERIGGLVGNNSVGEIEGSCATGSVEGDSNVGGLVGESRDTVTESFATGSVEGDSDVGGLVGRNQDTVAESYATGSVGGGNSVGGLVGRNDDTVTESYATGSVEGDSQVGGLVGSDNDGTVTDSYWDTETTGQSTSDGDGTGLTTTEMQGSEAETNMSGFDFEDVWTSVLESDDDTTADGYPILLAVDREDQLEAQGILSLIAFTASALVNSESVEIQDTFAQVNDEVREVTEVFALINGSVEQI